MWCLKCVLHCFLPEVYLLLNLLDIRLQTHNKRSSTFDTGMKCFNIFVQAPAIYFYIFATNKSDRTDEIDELFLEAILSSHENNSQDNEC